MKWFSFFLFLIVSNVSGMSVSRSVDGHTINYPVFDRIDVPDLRIEKIVLDNDTTYVFCKYKAEDYSWANISKETYFLSRETGKKYQILRCEGIPFSPEKRHFSHSGEFEFLFCFPAINNTEHIDFIESPDEKAFNIYGISLTQENDSISAQYSLERVTSLLNKAEIYNSTGNYEKAIELAGQVANACKALFGCKSSGYANSVNNLIYHCLYGGEYEKVVQFGEENALLCEELFGIESDEYALFEQLLASGYYRLSISSLDNNQFQKSLDFAKKSVEAFEKHPDDELYFNALGNLGTCFYLNGYYKDALRIGNKRYDLLVHSKGKDCWETIDAALRLSNYYGSLGFYNEKEKFLLEAIDGARKDTTSLAKPFLSTALNNLAVYYVTNNPYKALKCVEESYYIRKDLLGDSMFKNQPYYKLSLCQSLYNLGICLNEIAIEEHNLEKAEKAIDYIFGALVDAKSILGGNDYRYADMKEVITDFMIKAQNYEEATKNEKEIAQIYNSVFGANHLSFLQSQERMANLCFLRNDKEELIEFVKKVHRGYEEYVTYNFPILTSIEKAKLINKIEFFYDHLLPVIAYYQNDPEINNLLYNAQLFRKGILLNADLEANDIVKESKDTILVQMYDNIIAQKKLLYNQRQIPIEMRTVNLDSLEKEISVNENELLTLSTPYRKNIESQKKEWTDIKKEISESDLVIEFVSFMDTCNISQEHYMALAFSQESPYPELIHLFTKDKIIGLSPFDVSQLVWKPIMEKYKDKNNIYFSPSGILNNIGIEYMISDSDSLADHYNAYRLSSTRELLENKSEKLFSSAVLYGGLLYDVETSDMKKPSEPVLEPLKNEYRGIVPHLMARGGFDPLPNTFSEVNEIQMILEAQKVSARLFTGKEGTEKSFKILSGQNVSIIHLATHGMYITPTEAPIQRASNNFRFIQLGDNDIQEDYSLTRSFLVMAGGNCLSHHVSIPEMAEDGILTALEISTLDLKGLDLIVLSACQTALGDVNKEGVYGLQRAFKKAGANTILMSINKVSDDATRILMVEFYKNLMSGKSKLQSLRDAQKHLRKVESGKYDDPKYWASFIMLDGLN